MAMVKNWKIRPIVLLANPMMSDALVWIQSFTFCSAVANAGSVLDVGKSVLN